MSDVLDEATFAALQMFDGSLEGAGATPNEKLKIAMMYVHKLIAANGHAIQRKEFMSYAGAIVRKFDEQEMRRDDFNNRYEQLAKAHYNGHPKQERANV